MDQSLSSTPTDLTGIEESATNPDDDAKPHKQITRENNAGISCMGTIVCV